MKNLLQIFSLVLLTNIALSQCPNNNNLVETATVNCNGLYNTQTIVLDSCIIGGEYILLNVEIGKTYTFKTCNSCNYTTCDSQITIYEEISGNLLGFNDDFCTLRSQVTITPLVSQIRVLIDKWPCTNGGPCMILDVTYQCTFLPVELTNFSVRAISHNSFLNWQTASETNNAYFQIQHSPNGKDFQTIDEVTGMGTTNEETNYEYLHENPLEGINYYRLKQIDFDGTYTYSEIINIRMESNENKPFLTFFPNPVREELTLINHSNEPIDVIIFNSQGQRIVHLKIEDLGQVIHQTSYLNSGVYFIQITHNEQITTNFFLKNKA